MTRKLLVTLSALLFMLSLGLPASDFRGPSDRYGACILRTEGFIAQSMASTVINASEWLCNLVIRRAEALWPQTVHLEGTGDDRCVESRTPKPTPA